MDAPERTPTLSGVLLVREGFAMAILPPIAVRDELESGLLVEADTLPGITETFYAVTLKRRFPNLVVRSLISDAKGDVIKT